MKSRLFHLGRLIIFLPLWVASCSTPTPVTPSDVSYSGARSGVVSPNTVPSPWTVAEKFEEYQSQAMSGPPTGDDVGGNEGLVHLTISANVAFSEMAKAHDRASYTPLSTTSVGRIEDSNGNIWILYKPTSSAQFQAKGYDVKKSIDWSRITTSHTYTYEKLRFIKD